MMKTARILLRYERQTYPEAFCPESARICGAVSEGGGVKRESIIDLVVPHQASQALDVIMPRLGFRKEPIDRVSQYGNMISASVPYGALCRSH